MSFRLVIHNVSDSQLGALIARMDLPKTTTLEVTHISALEEIATNGTGKGAGSGSRASIVASTILKMTGREPQKSTMLRKALDVFEQMEVKHGIGTITVEALRTELKKQKQPSEMYTRLLNEGYIEQCT